MTIKQLGGIFGRDPTFNDVEIEGTLTVSNATLDNLTIDNAGTIQLTKNTSAQGDSLGIIEFHDEDGAAGADAGKFQLQAFRGADKDAPTFKLIGSDSVGTLTDRVEIGSAGDVTVSTGNLVIGTSGKGIDFSATSGTGTSELFDDYEEGVHQTTMTPGTSGTVTLNTSYDELQYTKIGNMVNVRGHIITDAVSSPVGSFVNISLPFAAVSGAGKRAGGAVHTYGIGSNVYATYPAHIADGSSSLAVFLDASTLTASDQITISFCYQSA